jgi:hypothetical protein
LARSGKALASGHRARGRFCRVIQPNEVADVLARFFHIFGLSSLPESYVPQQPLMVSERRFCQARQSIPPGLPVRLIEKWMNAVIDGIAGDD